MKVLFVCSGNTCRSPMAMALAKTMYPRWDVKSAGLHARQGDAMAKNARKVLEEEGISGVEHTAAPIRTELLEWADIIFTMDRWQKQQLLDEDPTLVVATLCEGAVADPFGQDVSVYRETLQQMKECLRRVKL